MRGSRDTRRRVDSAPVGRGGPTPEPHEEPIWVVMRYAAPVIIAVGAVLALVGLLAGQSVGIVAVDLLGVVLGVIMLLVVRWR